jgi:hypothetical protein
VFAVIVPVVAIVLLGCSPTYEIRVPPEFAISSNVDDLRGALAPGDGATPRRVAIVPHEEGTQPSFEICGSGDRGCRELTFAETGLVRSIDEVIDTVSERPGIERIIIVTDYRRRTVCDRFDADTDLETSAVGDSMSISCTSQGQDESLDRLVEAIDERIDMETDVVITVLGEATIEVIRRVGASGEDAGEEGGGVVAELFLPVTGRRLHTAGYPVLASIAYDFAQIFPISDPNDDESTQVYVPYGVFRY